MYGKGSKRRPTNERKYGYNYDLIFKRKKNYGKTKEKQHTTFNEAGSRTNGDTDITLEDNQETVS